MRVVRVAFVVCVLLWVLALALASRSSGPGHYPVALAGAPR